MKTIAIANILKEGKTAGFRLLNTDNGDVLNLGVGVLTASVQSKEISVSNLEVCKNTLVGSNGSIDRLPKIENGRLVGKSTLTIINRIGDVGYTVVDYKGKIARLNTKAVIEYANVHGISNGKVVGEHVASIRGKYKTILLKNTAEEANRKIKEYNVKSSLMGILPLNIKVSDEHVVLESAPRSVVKCHIPNFVTKIDTEAFMNCSKLVEVNIPSSVTEIGDQAFSSCESLKRVNIQGEGLKVIDRNAFSNCIRLENLNIPDSVEMINYGAFWGCTSLKSVNIPKNIDGIGSYVFNDCTSIKQIKIPEILENDMVAAFYEISDYNGQGDYIQFKPFLNKNELQRLHNAYKYAEKEDNE